MKKVLFIKNAFVLTATSLLLRLLGVIVKIQLAATIGSEGMGLYQLVFSVYILAATFATSGICTAVTRLVSDELCFGTKKSVRHIMFRSFLLTAIIAALSVIVLFFGADGIANLAIDDLRATSSIKVLSLSLIFMGFSSCMRGYFIACRKTFPPASSQILEQVVRIVIIMFLVKHFASFGIEYACAGVFLGDLIAEIFSFLLLFVFYRLNNKGLSYLVGRKTPPYSVTKQILRISSPISLGKYANSFLRTVENSLVPRQLVASGMKNSQALSILGSIKGMALPILFFPSCLLSSLSTLLIPEISEATAKNQKNIIKLTVEKTISLTALFGIIFGAVFFICGEDIGKIIYKDQEVGFLIKILAPVVPLMYLDSIADGLLKGLDQQIITFRNSILDSSSRIILILLILPTYKMAGFIAIMYFSNILTCFLNVFRLIKVSGAKIQYYKKIILPVFCSLAVVFFIKYIFAATLSGVLWVVFGILFSLLLYVLLLFLFGSITKKELQELF